MLIAHYIKTYIKYLLGIKYTPPEIIFFVTDRCNSRCRTCFYWRNLNRKQEMTLNEVNKFSKKLGNFYSLNISGGEPFMRNDLSKICYLFYKNNSINSLIIPTNGLLSKKIIKQVSEILEFYNKRLIISVSIDGIKKDHDSIRGVRGSFEKAIKTIKSLEKIKRLYNNLALNICTVCTNQNTDAISDIIKYFKRFNIDTHNIEYIRGSPKDQALKLPSLNKLYEIKKLQFLGLKKQTRKGFNFGIITKFYNALKYTCWDLQLLTLVNKKRLTRCYAGRMNCVIYPNGDVSICELKQIVGNLKKEDYDLLKILYNPKNKHAIEEAKKKCFCTHGNFIKTNVLYSPKHYLRILRNLT